ncbi:MAG: hypothetical protein OXC40_00510 [Proteobacteria bacterium]|nr:hypothetical protein [Pseudomonadota bacterium]
MAAMITYVGAFSSSSYATGVPYRFPFSYDKGVVLETNPVVFASLLTYMGNSGNAYLLSDVEYQDIRIQVSRNSRNSDVYHLLMRDDNGKEQSYYVGFCESVFPEKISYDQEMMKVNCWGGSDAIPFALKSAEYSVRYYKSVAPLTQSRVLPCSKDRELNITRHEKLGTYSYMTLLLRFKLYDYELSPGEEGVNTMISVIDLTSSDDLLAVQNLTECH